MVKANLKPILPSMREKKRYLAFEIVSKDKIDNYKNMSDSIRNCAFQALGVFGLARAGMIILENKWNPNTQRGIIKVNHKYVDSIKSSLIFCDEINSKPAFFKSLCVSGMLNKAEKFLTQN